MCTTDRKRHPSSDGSRENSQSIHRRREFQGVYELIFTRVSKHARTWAAVPGLLGHVNGSVGAESAPTGQLFNGILNHCIMAF